MVVGTLILGSVGLVLLVLYVISTWKFDYWKKKNVPFIKPTLLVGNYGDYILMKKSFGEVAQELCRKFPKQPYFGTYFGTEPALMIQDPQLIKLVTTKDFYFFNAREAPSYTKKEVTTQNLFFNHGDVWKVLRNNMTPMFTPSKMKNMFHLIKKCSHLFERMLDEETSMSEVLDVKTPIIRYTMDCIGSCTFGLETNTMKKDFHNNPFKHIGDMVFYISNLQNFGIIARSIWPGIFYSLGFTAYPKAMTDFFYNMLVGVFKSRDYKPSPRNDFVDLILNWKQTDYITCDNWAQKSVDADTPKIKLQVDDAVLVSQCIVLFAAGYETSSNALSFTLFELAKNKEAQERAIAEVDQYIQTRKGNLEYDVTELVYLDACINEAMRLYPALGVITREVVEDYTLPSGLLLKKGTRVHLPIYHLHRDPQYFPDPEEYRPERFLPDNKNNITPYTYMPFGEGARLCIGYRLAKMQMLAGLVTFLKKFRVELAEDMPRSVKLESRGVVNQTRSPIRLKMIVREGWETRVLVPSV